MIPLRSVSWLIALCLGVASARAADESAPPVDLTFEVRDLVFKIEDIGGKVVDLEMKETDTEIRIELAADVLFDFDKADLRKEARSTLKQVAAIVSEKAKGTVRIEGHSDAKGSDTYNQKLSERRANAVRDWLIKNEGLKSVKFSTVGHGAKKPAVPNAKPDGSDDPNGRQKNRRVEIVIGKKG